MPGDTRTAMGDIDLVRDKADVQRLFRHLAACPREILAFAYLDRDSRLIGLRHSASAQIMSARIPLRAVARDVVRLDALRVVMAHNHPSGDPQPSRADLAVTKRLAMALGALGAPLVEHVILARGGGVFSLRGAGFL